MGRSPHVQGLHTVAQSHKLQAYDLIYGHTSMAVRLIYAEALEVGHLGRLQRERGSVTGGAGSSGSSLVPPVYPPRHRVPPTPEAGVPPIQRQASSAFQTTNHAAPQPHINNCICEQFLAVWALFFDLQGAVNLRMSTKQNVTHGNSTVFYIGTKI